MADNKITIFSIVQKYNEQNHLSIVLKIIKEFLVFPTIYSKFVVTNKVHEITTNDILNSCEVEIKILLHKFHEVMKSHINIFHNDTTLIKCSERNDCKQIVNELIEHNRKTFIITNDYINHVFNVFFDIIAFSAYCDDILRHKLNTSEKLTTLLENPLLVAKIPNIYKPFYDHVFQIMKNMERCISINYEDAVKVIVRNVAEILHSQIKYYKDFTVTIELIEEMVRKFIDHLEKVVSFPKYFSNHFNEYLQKGCDANALKIYDFSSYHKNYTIFTVFDKIPLVYRNTEEYYICTKCKNNYDTLDTNVRCNQCNNTKYQFEGSNKYAEFTKYVDSYINSIIFADN